MAFICEFCPTNFGERKTLNRHVRTKHSNASFECERCELTTNRKDKLKHHLESKHYGNKAKCTYCTFEYERKDSLDRHVKSYQEVNPLSPTPDFDWVEDVEMEEMHPQNS